MENLKVMSTKTDAVIDEKIEIDVAIPKMWHVVVMNDEFTPMELVVDILKSVFKLEEDIANKKTLEIHNHMPAHCFADPTLLQSARGKQRPQHVAMDNHTRQHCLKHAAESGIDI